MPFLVLPGQLPGSASALYSAAQDKVPRIGFLGRLAPNSEQKQGFQQGLRALGYGEGRSILAEWRNTLGYEEELRPLAAEPVQMAPDVSVIFGMPASCAGALTGCAALAVAAR